MPYLGDYLGHIVSEITIARLQADLETARVAELYATHPLLKHMPVPHFRLPSVTLKVPVAVAKMEEAAGEAPRGALDAGSVRTAFRHALDGVLKREGIALNTAARKQVDAAIDKTMTTTADHAYLSGSAVTLADDLTRSVVGALPQVQQRQAGAIQSAARTEIARLRQPPPRLHVAVTTAELKEHPQEALTHLNLSISEQGVEWVTIESEGQTTSRLRPE